MAAVIIRNGWGYVDYVPVCRNCHHARDRFGVAHNCIGFFINEEGRWRCGCEDCS